jgi:hypothetical protein
VPFNGQKKKDFKQVKNKAGLSANLKNITHVTLKALKLGQYCDYM